jgi:hypothetical protein
VVSARRAKPTGFATPVGGVRFRRSRWNAGDRLISILSQRIPCNQLRLLFDRRQIATDAGETTAIGLFFTFRRGADSYIFRIAGPESIPPRIGI